MAKDELAMVENFSALAPPTEGFGINEVIAANFGPRGITPRNLQRISVPTGGAVSWQIETIDGTESVKHIDGIVVAVREPRVRYKLSFDEADGSNNPPDCYSHDGITGVGDPGGPCELCPHDVWGTGRNGRGKACDERRMILVLEPETILPLIVSAPPTSLKNWGDYMGRLTARALPHHAVVTRLGLEADKNPEGKPFSKIKPEFLRKLRGEEIAELQKYINAVLPAFQQVSDIDTPKDAI